MTNQLRRVFVESPNSLGAKARMRRWTMLQNFFPGLEDMRVLDLGGTVKTWTQSPVRPKHVTILNLSNPGTVAADDPSLRVLVGDACRASDALVAAKIDLDFDLVFSNSLIEHVGGHSRRVEVAEQVRHLAPHYWVQTPYRYFPVEPHWLFPGMQFMPTPIRTGIALRWPLAHSISRNSGPESARERVLWTELVGITEMRVYFPESVILHEKILGLTKSIIAAV